MQIYHVLRGPGVKCEPAVVLQLCQRNVVQIFLTSSFFPCVNQIYKMYKQPYKKPTSKLCYYDVYKGKKQDYSLHMCFSYIATCFSCTCIASNRLDVRSRIKTLKYLKCKAKVGTSSRLYINVQTMYCYTQKYINTCTFTCFCITLHKL